MACLLQWAEAYLDFCKQKFIHNTYQEKVKAFRFLFRSISPALPVERLTRGQVLDHLTGLVRAGRSGNAANSDRKNLIAAWNWGRRNMAGFPQENPFSVERFPEVRSPRYVPPLADFWAVLKQAESEQDRVMLLAYLYLAARRSEVFRLQVGDVDLARRRVRLWTRKRSDGALEFHPFRGTSLSTSDQIQGKGKTEGPQVFILRALRLAFTKAKAKSERELCQ